MTPTLAFIAPLGAATCDGVLIGQAGCLGTWTLDQMTRHTVWTYPDINPPGEPVLSVVWGCPADANGDGVVNGLDFGAWLGHFNNGHPRADSNLDGEINGLDHGAWLASFNGGCE